MTDHGATDPDERRIAHALVAGDRDALAEAFSRWGRMIHAIGTRAAGPDAADDLTQSVFVEAWRSRARFDPERGVVPGWLVGIARNQIRRDARRHREVPIDRDVEHPEDSREDAVANQVVLAQALSDLDPTVRSTLELSYWHGLTQTEVATRLDLPLGTVKSHQRRGLARLRDILEVSRG